jgi:hypothetical protein
MRWFDLAKPLEVIRLPIADKVVLLKLEKYAKR